MEAEKTTGRNPKKMKGEAKENQRPKSSLLQTTKLLIEYFQQCEKEVSMQWPTVRNAMAAKGVDLSPVEVNNPDINLGQSHRRLYDVSHVLQVIGSIVCAASKFVLIYCCRDHHNGEGQSSLLAWL